MRYETEHGQPNSKIENDYCSNFKIKALSYKQDTTTIIKMFIYKTYFEEKEGPTLSNIVLKKIQINQINK